MNKNHFANEINMRDEKNISNFKTISFLFKLHCPFKTKAITAFHRFI